MGLQQVDDDPAAHGVSGDVDTLSAQPRDEVA